MTFGKLVKATRVKETSKKKRKKVVAVLCSTRPHLFLETTENVLQINRDAESDSLQGNKILIIITHGRYRRW